MAKYLNSFSNDATYRIGTLWFNSVETIHLEFQLSALDRLPISEWTAKQIKCAQFTNLQGVFDAHLCSPLPRFWLATKLGEVKEETLQVVSSIRLPVEIYEFDELFVLSPSDARVHYWHQAEHPYLRHLKPLLYLCGHVRRFDYRFNENELEK